MVQPLRLLGALFLLQFSNEHVCMSNFTNVSKVFQLYLQSVEVSTIFTGLPITNPILIRDDGPKKPFQQPYWTSNKADKQ